MSILFHCFTVLVFLLICSGNAGASHSNTGLSITLASQKNQTGHAITKLLLDKSSAKVPNQWKISIQHDVTEHQGIQTFHLLGIFALPPKRPSDYELFPGVGYYKFHTSFANGFEQANSVCTKEGGHLAIVNSESEHQVLQTMFAKYTRGQVNTDWAFVGFHDRFKEGEYVTIFGQPLHSTGFKRWASAKEPDNYKGNENCGSVHRNGGLNDITCDSKHPFFCEYDLTWGEF